MQFGIKTLDDIDVHGKTILCRVDINEPVDRETGELKDLTRIEACIPTLTELSDKGAKVVVLAHQGSDIEYKNYYTTKPHAKAIQQLMNREIAFIDDVCGPAAKEHIKQLNNGDILVLDNVRFLAEEQTLFEWKLKLTHEEQAQTLLVKSLAPLADFYVCDAFAAAHRDQPSLCGFQQLLPSAMGRLFEREFTVLSQLMHKPEKPCVFVLGGAKIDDAFRVMSTVLSNGVADCILTGGLVAQVLLWASRVDIGERSWEHICSLGYDGLADKAKDLLNSFADKIVLPSDLAYIQDDVRCECPAGGLPDDELVSDIGTETALRYREIILKAKTVFVNGPVGVFEIEASGKGTNAIWNALSDTQAYTVIGGGDSITATKKYNAQIDYICTGGGALIQFLSGTEMPVVKSLRHGATIK